MRNVPLLGLALLSVIAANAPDSNAASFSAQAPIVNLCPANLANCQDPAFAKRCHTVFAQQCGAIFKANINLTNVPSETRILPPSNIAGFTSILPVSAFGTASKAADGTSTGLTAGSGVNIPSSDPNSAVPIAPAHVQPVSQSTVKKVDPTSYRSLRENARRSVQVCMASSSGCNPYPGAVFKAYETRHELSSCVEYAWAKFADYSKWENKIAELGEDYRAMVNAAFESGAVGLLHLGDGMNESVNQCASVGPLKTYSRDQLGTAYGFIYGRQPKNALVGNTAGIAYAVNGGNFEAMTYYDQWIPSHTPWVNEPYNAKFPLRTWFSHLINRNATAQQTQMAGKNWNDATLNYLYDLQKEFSVLARVAHQKAVEYSHETTQIGGQTIHIHPVVPGLSDAPKPTNTPCKEVEDPTYSENEALARSYTPAVLAAKLKQYVDVFQQYGCFQSGTTPCDWSPKFFVEDLRQRVGALVEKEYQSCLMRAPNPANFYDTSPDPADEIGSELEQDKLNNNLSDYDWRIKRFTTQNGVKVNIPISSLLFLSQQERTELASIVGSNTLTDQNLGAYCTESTHNRYADSVVAFERFVTDQPKMKNKRRICKIAAYASKLLSDSESHLAGPDGTIYAPQFHHVQSHEEGGAMFGAGFSYDTQFQLRRVGKVNDAFQCPSAYFKTSMSGKASVLGVNATLLDVTAEVEGAKEQLSLNVFGTPVYASGSQVQFSTVGAPGKNFTKTLADGYVSLLGIPIHYTAGYSGSAGLTIARTGSTIACHNASLGGVWYGPVPNDGAHDGLTVKPYMSVGGFVQAAVDAGVVSAGVRGQLTLVDIQLPVSADIAFTQQTESSSIISTQSRSITKTKITDSADLSINYLSGNIEAFAELDLGITSKSASTTLASWDGLHQNMPLQPAENYGFAFEDLRRYFDLLGGEPVSP